MAEVLHLETGTDRDLLKTDRDLHHETVKAYDILNETS